MRRWQPATPTRIGSSRSAGCSPHAPNPAGPYSQAVRAGDLLFLAGQIPMTFATVIQALSQYQAGLVRALGVAASERHKSIPNVPTFREQGFDILVMEWYGLLAPAGTPKPIIAKLSAEMRRILALPEVAERLAAIEMLGS